MKYGYSIIYVDNVNETISFYEMAFGFKRKFITPEGDYGELASGETSIAFASIELGKANFKGGFVKTDKAEKPFGVELAFVSENIEADFKRALDAGATLFEPLSKKSWGQKVGYVRDNNGFLIEICTPVNSQ